MCPAPFSQVLLPVKKLDCNALLSIGSEENSKGSWRKARIL
jgi:hypothetical protein